MSAETLNIFPWEVWELIINSLLNTNDVSNLLEACPQLKKLAHGKQFSWLVGQIIPLISSKFLRSKDILACRLVSKTWNNAICTFLENHPDDQPYSVGQQQIFSFTQQHFMYNSRPRVYTSLYHLINSEWAATASNPCKINPILGRTVTIFLDSSTATRQWSPNVNPRVGNPTFEKFGQHIWHITLHLNGFLREKEHLMFQVIPSMFNFLSCLPNLKSLKLASYHIREVFNNNEEFSPEESTLVPFPAHLVTLDLNHVNEASGKFHDFLIMQWANHDQVRKLGINAESWNSTYGPLFPNITELTVHLFSPLYDPKIPSLDQILADLKCTHLKKLRVHFSEYNANMLLEAVEPYQIEVLEIGGNNFDDYHFKRGVLLPSVRDCKVYATPYAKFKFLKAFPNLEYLTVKVSHVDDPSPSVHSDDEEDDPVFLKCLRNYVSEEGRRSYNFDSIWHELPTLKVFTVISRQFVREHPGRVFKSYSYKPIHDFCYR